MSKLHLNPIVFYTSLTDYDTPIDFVLNRIETIKKYLFSEKDYILTPVVLFVYLDSDRRPVQSISPEITAFLEENPYKEGKDLIEPSKKLTEFLLGSNTPLPDFMIALLPLMFFICRREEKDGEIIFGEEVHPCVHFEDYCNSKIPYQPFYKECPEEGQCPFCVKKEMFLVHIEGLQAGELKEINTNESVNQNIPRYVDGTIPSAITDLLGLKDSKGRKVELSKETLKKKGSISIMFHIMKDPETERVLTSDY